MELVRTFVAVELSPEVKSALAQAQERLRKESPAIVRWVAPQGIHLTLKFLGPIALELVPRVVAAVTGAARLSAPFSLQLGGLGAFPGDSAPRVVWVGVVEGQEALQSLQEAVEEALAPTGFSRERRPFSPHLTLGRVREGADAGERRLLGQALGRVAVPTFPRMAVAEVWVIQSTLTPRGALYTPLGSGRLGG